MNSIFLDENKLRNSQKTLKTMEKPAFWGRTTYTNLVPQYFNPDNLIPKDVSHRGLCLVKKEL